jgi:hypothetical protein
MALRASVVALLGDPDGLPLGLLVFPLRVCLPLLFSAMLRFYAFSA